MEGVIPKLKGEGGINFNYVIPEIRLSVFHE